MENLETNPMQGQLKPAKLKSFGELFRHTMNFIKANKRQLFYFYLFPVVFLLALNILTQEVARVGIATHSFLFGFLAIVLFVVSLIATIVGNTITYGSSGVIHRLQSGEKLDLRTEYKKLMKMTPSFIFVLAICYFFSLGGIVLFLVPGIMLIILSTFSLVVLPVEEKRGTDAILRSFELISGRKLSVFLRVLCFAFSMILFFICLVLIFFLIAFLISVATHTNILEVISYLNNSNNGLFYGSLSGVLIKILFILTNAIISVGVSSFYMSFLYFMYKDAKETAVLKDEVYRTKTKKMIKGFAWFGFVAVILLILSVPVVSYINAKSGAMKAGGALQHETQQTEQ